MPRKTDVEFIKDNENWPRWPFLPLVRRDDMAIAGLIVATHNPKPEVIIGANLWQLKEYPGKTYGEKFGGLRVKTYESFEELLKEWRID